MVESPTRPWSSLSCFEATPSIQVSIAGLWFPSQCPSGTILLTPYSMVLDRRVSRAGPMLFIGLSCSIPTIVFYSFSLSLLSVYRLVLWVWGLRTDRVYITLSLSLALPTSFHNNNNNNNNNKERCNSIGLHPLAKCIICLLQPEQPNYSLCISRVLLFKYLIIIFNRNKKSLKKYL